MTKTKNKNKVAIEILRKGIPVLTVLADEKRQDIVLALADEGELNVNEITDRINLSRPAISHHLKQLKNVGLVEIDRRGTENYYYLTLENALDMLKELTRIIEENHKLKRR